MTEKKEEVKTQKCSHLTCNQDATWKGTAEKEDVDKRNINRVRGLFQVGIWFYCDKHKKIIEGGSPHLKFEAL